jgi:CHAD domain-containing protein
MGVPGVHAEVETKFDVPPDFAMPDLSAYAGPNGRLVVDQVRLSSTYHDTAGSDLLRFRLTLRRRLGDVDTGWHLKVPARAGRTELHWPAEGDTPPGEVKNTLRPFLRDAAVVPTVRLDVSRTRHRLVTSADELIAEVAQDDVRAAGLRVQVRAPRWHEVEVELGTGPRETLAEIGSVLVHAGAFPSASPSKLARALRGIGNERVDDRPTTAGATLVNYIAQQSDALVGGHFAIARDAPDSVHQTRVATRRLRSTLRTFANYFAAEPAAELEGELQWYARLLGEVRDREVLLARLQKDLAELPEDLIVGPVPEHISTQLTGELAVHRAELVDAMQTERYADLLGRVANWRVDPPFIAAAAAAPQALQEEVDRMQRKLIKQLALATDRAGSAEDMHRARKTGKRLRYAAEAADKDSDVVAETIALQDLLGEFQDSIGAQQVLRRLAGEAAQRGEDGFTYGMLVAQERQRAAHARSAARQAKH